MLCHYLRYLATLVALCLVVACSSDKQTMEHIMQAESIMLDAPDQALDIIESIDREKVWSVGYETWRGVVGICEHSNFSYS